jgi:hypothetical protein
MSHPREKDGITKYQVYRRVRPISFFARNLLSNIDAAYPPRTINIGQVR